MSKLKQVFLAIAIAIVFVFFVGFGILTFYKAPKYEDFCEDRYIKRPVPMPLKEPVNCTSMEVDENLNNECKDKGYITPKYDENGCVESYYCETCEKEYNDIRENYSRNVFIIATVIGVVVLIIGFALKIASVSSGLMGGGILAIMYGTIQYWTSLPDYGRFTIFGITLAILIWLGYKKLKK